MDIKGNASDISVVNSQGKRLLGRGAKGKKLLNIF
jgi:hypothetical protein